MRKILIMVAIIAAGLHTAAVAADWVFVSENTDGDRFYIERQSIQTTSKNYKRAWVKAYYQIPFGHITGFKNFEEYDCREGRSRSLQIIYFSGREIVSIRNKPDVWSFAAPQTSAETKLKYVCFDQT